MDKYERFVIAMLIIIFLSLSIAVIKTAYGLQQEVQNVIKKEKEKRHLPSLCAPHYGKGGEWIKCMGVGYK
jgi:hypothetical protein